MNLRSTRAAHHCRRLWHSLRALRLVDVRRLHESVESTHLARLLSHLRVDCVFDVGANVGQYARMLRSSAGYKGLIISFEPIPELAERLRTKAKSDGQWIVESLALSGHTGTASFQVMHGTQFSSLSAPRHDEFAGFAHVNRVTKTITVATETLDDAFSRLQQRHGFERPFLKMDTQGYDVAIVQASHAAISQFVGLQSELAIKKLYTSSIDFRDALAVYHDVGYELSSLVPNNAGQFPALVEIDCIMVRRDCAPASPNR